MKKVLSTLVAAIVALSFAGIVCAAETIKTETSTTSPAGEVKVEKKEVKKHVKKHRKHKKHHHKKVVKKEDVTPAEAAVENIK
jgi:Ni/Co efflux regulator RcnB